MTELERSLTALQANVAWPATPAFRLELDAAPRRSRPRRRLLLAVALVALALGVAVAVPPARSAILRVLHIGGATVERVDTLPEAEERPLAADLGAPLGASDVRAVLGQAFAYPNVEGHSKPYGRGTTVSVLLAVPERVLLSESGAAYGEMMLKKVAAGQTGVEWVEIVPGVSAVWLSGARHVVYLYPRTPPRLAGNVLLFAYRGLTFRLEGPALTRELALRLARDLVG
jgi:hypothetical protein